MAAAVLLPAGLVMLHAHGLFLAEADGADAVGGNAERNEVLLDGAGAAVTETKIVFGGAALVAVALDVHFDGRMSFEEVRRAGERLASVGADVRFVSVEISVVHVPGPQFIERRLFNGRSLRRSIHGDGGGGAGGAAGTGSGDGVSGGI